VRAEAATQHDPALLAAPDPPGDRGQTLAGQLRERIHCVRDAGRRLAASRNCRPIYCHVFTLATSIVLQRIQADEKDERQACTETKLAFEPSEFLWSLANRAAFYERQAELYGQENPEGDPDILPAPAQALAELWRGIKEAK
jgi:hypothetical protein